MSGFDLILIFIFLVTQTWLMRFFLRGRGLRGRIALGLFEAGVAFCYLLSFSDLSASMGLSGSGAEVAGACGLFYLIACVPVAMLLASTERFGRKMDPGRRRMLEIAGTAAIAAPLGFGYIKRTDFHVREVDVPVAQLPEDLDGLRILQISDIHLSPFLSERDLSRAIDAAAGLHPHIAMVTGDLISTRGDPLDACIRQLARLKADAGVFGCMGNHERYAKVERYTQDAAARVGIEFLRHTNRQLRFGNSVVNIAGVDHQSLAGKQIYLRGAERLVQPGAFNILLSHNPDVFPVAARQGYNFMLSGHTHGGQVTVEILDQSINPARFFTPYVYGLYRSGNAAAYVTRGIGTIGIPARIGAPPEISLIRLRKA